MNCCPDQLLFVGALQTNKKTEQAAINISFMSKSVLKSGINPSQPSHTHTSLKVIQVAKILYDLTNWSNGLISFGAISTVLHKIQLVRHMKI